MSDKTFGQCATLIGYAAIPKNLLVVPTPTKEDAGKVFSAGEDGTVEWKELKVPSQTIQKIESLDKTNKVSIRSLNSGSYVLCGYFVPYEGATSTMVFSSDLLVNIVKGTTESHAQVFYPYNNQVQCIKITDTSHERTDIKLNELQKQSITDDGGYFTTKTVEAALQELGSSPKLPTVSASDKGKVLRVSESGSWVAEAISNAEEASF